VKIVVHCASHLVKNNIYTCYIVIDVLVIGSEK